MDWLSFLLLQGIFPLLFEGTHTHTSAFSLFFFLLLFPPLCMSSEDPVAILESLIETFRQCCSQLERYESSTGEEALAAQINRAIDGMNALVAATTPKAGEEPVMVPMEVFSLLDSARSPDVFVRESLAKCLETDEKNRARSSTFSALRDQVAADFAEAFPDDYKSFVRQAGPGCSFATPGDMEEPQQQQHAIVTSPADSVVKSEPEPAPQQITDEMADSAAPEQPIVSVDESGFSLPPHHAPVPVQSGGMDDTDDEVLVEINKGEESAGAALVDIVLDENTK